MFPFSKSWGTWAPFIMLPIPAHTEINITKWWWIKDQEDGYYQKDLLVTGTAFKKITRWENTSDATSSSRNREPAAAIVVVVVVVVVIVCDTARNKALNLYIDMVDVSGGFWCWRGTKFIMLIFPKSKRW